jgi:hypothetical protein
MALQVNTRLKVQLKGQIDILAVAERLGFNAEQLDRLRTRLAVDLPPGADAPVAIGLDTAVSILRSTTCLSCGGAKRKGWAFCYQCYGRLTPILQAKLYRKVGDGFESAYTRAAAWLGGYH